MIFSAPRAPDSMVFDLIPAGAINSSEFWFPEDQERDWANKEGVGLSAVPRKVHYGFLDPGSDDWQDVVDVEVLYDDSGFNEAVSVDVPERNRGRRFVYVLGFEDAGGGEYWSEHRYVNLEDPAGTFVCVPALNFARYPWLASLYHVAVWEHFGSEPVVYPGKIKSIIYGYTTCSRSEYENTPDIPWENSYGEAFSEGDVTVVHRHDGLYKGSFVMAIVWIRVPAGKHLVFRLGIDKYHRDEWWQDHDEGHAETKAYLREGLVLERAVSKQATGKKPKTRG